MASDNCFGSFKLFLTYNHINPLGL